LFGNACTSLEQLLRTDTHRFTPFLGEELTLATRLHSKGRFRPYLSGTGDSAPGQRSDDNYVQALTANPPHGPLTGPTFQDNGLALRIDIYQKFVRKIEVWRELETDVYALINGQSCCGVSSPPITYP
jgi:hypothetical protein